MRKGVNLLVLILALVSVISFVSANTVYINPASIPSVDQGNNFDLEVRVSTSTSNIYAIQFDVDYNPAMLTLNSITEGGFFSSDGASTVFSEGTLTSGKADNVYGARNKTYLESSQGITGDGIIAVLNFTANGVGTSTVSFSDVTWVNSTITNDTAQTITPTLTSGSVTIVGVPCTLTNAFWSTSSTVGGTLVNLIVTGNNCNGQPVRFVVWEYDTFPGTDDSVSINPVNVNFVGNTATGSWLAEWQGESFPETDPPEYYYNVTLVNNVTESILSSDPKLNVDQAPGILTAQLNDPIGDVNKPQNQFFVFNTTVRCSVGDCGTVTATLDPIFGGTVTTNSGGTGANAIRCGVYSILEEGVVKNISWHGSASGNCIAGIYNVSSGNPVNLLVQSGSQASSGTVWHTYMISDYFLDAGDYALCIVCNADYGYSYEDLVGRVVGHNNNVYAFSNPFGSIDMSRTWNMAIYASYDNGLAPKGIIPMNSGTPFYTIDSNPASCGSMNIGDNCTTTWRVNATGNVGDVYEFFVTYNSSKSGVLSVDTAPKIKINITEPTAPVCVDTDGDGYGNPGDASCSNGALTDCDDTNNTIHPGATEICNGIDDDCDSETDEGLLITFYRDFDSDTFGNLTNTISACAQPVGYVVNSLDCNDSNSLILPGATEICGNGVDDDCDGDIDVVDSECGYDYDINNDSFVNIGDVSMAAMTFGFSCSGPSWCGGRDVNVDGVVNILDLSLIGMNFT